MVIASDTGANNEIIKDKKTGYIYKYNDIDDLKCKMLFALNNSEKNKEKIINAYEFAKSSFSPDLYTLKIFDVYSEVSHA